jgi:hypothetical protein
MYLWPRAFLKGSNSSKELQTTYIDMMRISIIAGTGGSLSPAPRRVQALLALTDAFQPEGITRIFQDSVFMMPHLGLLSTLHSNIAWGIFDRDCARACPDIRIPMSVHTGRSPCDPGPIAQPVRPVSTLSSVGEPEIELFRLNFIPPCIDIVTAGHRITGQGCALRYRNYQRPHQGIGYLYPADIYFRDLKKGTHVCS